jgi:hypothetical protein
VSVEIGLDCTYDSISVKNGNDTSGPSKSGKDKESDLKWQGSSGDEVLNNESRGKFESADLVINHK